MVKVETGGLATNFRISKTVKSAPVAKPIIPTIDFGRKLILLA